MKNVKEFFNYQYEATFKAKRWQLIVGAGLGTILVFGLVL